MGVAVADVEPQRPVVTEDAPDFVGNARIKALAAACGSSLPALADDSGFCVAALRGAPGVYSARWAGPTKDFSSAMDLVNHSMGEVSDRRAWFVAALCLAWPDGHAETFVGRVDGLATWPPRGTNGFGYDPLFFFPSINKTFAELTAAEKAHYSHRGEAFRKFLEWYSRS